MSIFMRGWIYPPPSVMKYSFIILPPCSKGCPRCLRSAAQQYKEHCSKLLHQASVKATNYSTTQFKDFLAIKVCRFSVAPEFLDCGDTTLVVNTACC